MKKTVTLLLALILTLSVPFSVLGAQASEGHFVYSEELRALQFCSVINEVVEHDIVEIENRVYTLTDGVLSLIDGSKQGTVEIGDKTYYVDSSRAFTPEEYEYLSENVIDKKLTAIVEVSGIDYCFKDGLLFSGIIENKYYDRGIFAATYYGNVNFNGVDYYVRKGKLANGLYKSRYYKSGLVDTTKNGIVLVKGTAYYFKKGVLSTSIVTELYGENAGKKVLYKKGVFTDKTGPVNVNNYGYYLLNGVAQSGKIKVKGKYRYYSKKSNKLFKNKSFRIKRYLYVADKNGILSHAPLIYIQQNTTANESIPYPSKEKPKATIASGGCGVCTSLMVIENTTRYSPSLVEWKKKMEAYGCRVNGGTDIRKTAKLMKETYGFSYVHTKSIKKLREHLKKGYMAICNVGDNGYFAYGGHYVVAVGIAKNGSVIVFDPYMTPTKYYSTCKGVDRTKYFKYFADTNEVMCSFKTLKKGSKGEYYYLFTPTKEIALRKTLR